VDPHRINSTAQQDFGLSDFKPGTPEYLLLKIKFAARRP